MDELFPDEMPSDEDSSVASRGTVSPEPVSLSFKTKFLFWISVWVGTTLAGVTLGFGFGFFASSAGGEPDIWAAVVLLTLCWAGGIGAFLMIHIATFKWMFGIDCSPKLIAGLAGGLTGLSTVCFFFVTVPLGVFGATIAANLFLKTSLGSEVLRYEAWRLDPTNQRPKKNFTIMDLMLRMTAISVLLAFWTLLLNQ